jgi:hypothetical protein
VLGMSMYELDVSMTLRKYLKQKPATVRNSEERLLADATASESNRRSCMCAGDTVHFLDSRQSNKITTTPREKRHVTNTKMGMTNTKG